MGADGLDGRGAHAPESHLERGTFPQSWSEGTELEPGPAFVSHAYNPDFHILRQSGRTHFEKPFLYLLFGADRAMLVDTGAPGADLAGAVHAVLARWSASRGRPAPPLLVTHTHGHSDHVAGDAQFAGMAATTLVGAGLADVVSYFGMATWPNGVGAVDLGGRPIDVIPIPGHEPASIAFYDRRTGILLPGDVLYPGRLYVRDAAAFRESVARLVAFTRSRPLAHILGAHVENTRTPFLDYPDGTVFQPEEHALELGRAHLLELDDALDGMGERIERRVLRDFTIWPVSAVPTTAE
jgi:hydroxyacylglutathione hydrolase